VRASPATIDDFLATLPADQRGALELLRGQIHAAAPEATETIAYGIPGFRLKGRYLLGFGAARKHCSFYCGTLLRNFDVELAGYGTRKGTIHFTPDKPIPPGVVEQIVRARVADIEGRGAR
jgi:uncharacterized protein YdhG (YjbR/CyaY superfamily)